MRHRQDDGLLAVSLVVDEAALHPHLTVTHVDPEWRLVVVDLAVLDNGESARARRLDVLIEVCTDPEVWLDVDAHTAVVYAAIGDADMPRLVNSDIAAHISVDLAVLDHDIAAREARG